MDSEHHEEEPTDSLRELAKAVPDETIRMLDRMVGLGWIERWSRNDLAGTWDIKWSERGGNRLGNVRDTLDVVGCLDVLGWLAFSDILRGKIRIYPAGK